MKSFWLFVFSILTFTTLASPPPHEGLWLPLFIKDFNYNEMKRSGLKMSADQLYDINKPCIKDAIVEIGNGKGSGAVISKNGLLLTTYQNILPYLTELSTSENNILKNGFWAKTKTEEKLCTGLTVTFLIRMENVSREVLESIPENIPEYKRAELVQKKIQKIIAKYADDKKVDLHIEPLCYGNEYYLFFYQEFKDIRLVVAPPSEMALFGGENERWMWPRHNSDFSLLRIYGAPDGSPSEYAPENIPITPKYFLPISLKGYNNNDFSMIWGFPQNTNRFISSPEIKFRTEKYATAFVEASNAILPPLRNAINTKDNDQIFYGTIYNTIANQYIRQKGEIDNLYSLSILDEIQKRESKMKKWGLLQDDNPIFFDSIYVKIDTLFSRVSLDQMRCYWYGNVSLQSSKFLMLPYHFQNVTPTPKSEQEIDQIIKDYQNLTSGADKDLEIKLIQASISLWNKLPEELRPQISPYVIKFFNNDYNAFASAIVNKSIFSSDTTLRKFLENPKSSIYKADPLIRYFHEIIKTISKGESVYLSMQEDLIPLQREYAHILLEMNKQENDPYYPEANNSLRVSFGKITGYQPSNAITYQYYTNHIGILEKNKGKRNNPNYKLPPSLIDILTNQDFGSYEYDGELRICFITNADSGFGNNGSPVLDGDGAIIGMMFDSNRESLGYQYLYNYELHRSICLDVRYIIFLLEKFGGVPYLFDEMNLIQ